MQARIKRFVLHPLILYPCRLLLVGLPPRLPGPLLISMVIQQMAVLALHHLQPLRQQLLIRFQQQIKPALELDLIWFLLVLLRAVQPLQMVSL